MRNWTAFVVYLVSAAVLAGCWPDGERTVSAGARPAVEVPIGPPPGPDPVLRIRANPFEGSRAASMEGRRLFVWFNCAGCHGDHGGGGMGPSLRDATWLYGSSAAHVFSSIASGRRHGMPSWGTKLPEDQIWKIVTYIGVLETPLEPEPPPANPSWPSPAP